MKLPLFGLLAPELATDFNSKVIPQNPRQIKGQWQAQLGVYSKKHLPEREFVKQS
jgi:hypothetical protein